MIEVSVKKSYSFSLVAMNEDKKQVLIDKAQAILDLKNEVSVWICENFLKFTNMNKFDMIKEFKNINPLISGQDFQHAIYDVYTKYENKIDAFKSNINIRIQDSMVITHYKRKTNNNQVGDTKSFDLKMKKSNLTQTVSYLTKFYNDGLFDYMNKQLELNELEESKANYYKMILGHVDKFDDRIIKLALGIRERVVNKLTQHPIVFSSLSFNSINRLSIPIVEFNKNKQSKYQCFITLGGMPKGINKLEIPTKYSKKYHGKLKDYQKGHNTSYSIVFRDGKPVKLSVAVDRVETYQTDKTNVLGADVNVKHNLFALSNGQTIDYDRVEFNEFIKFLKKLDAKRNKIKKENDNKTQPLSKRDQRFLTTHQIRFKDSLKRCCRRLVDDLITEGRDHLVIEDLGSFGKSFIRSEEFEGFKYSRLVRLLNLGDLKNILSSMCLKSGIQLTLVQPHYTSQQCSRCGYISRENRKDQEHFECVECGLTLNADYNASLVISSRVSVDVLQSKLLKKDKFGQLKPKIMKKSTIKTILESNSWVELHTSNCAPVINSNQDLTKLPIL
jgi:IS605 OrfB family transposase